MPAGAQQSPSDPAALQAQLNQMVVAKQQMQKQIDGYKAQVTSAQASFQQLNQP
jgi:multidrug resistance efflux pump